ncbi:MAG: hypothetical protein PWR31_944 [Bacillota bacterium]|nr:hypothetical protein [Bacillota bacterium]
MDKGQQVSFRIPEDLAKEFGRELRVVVRHPWTVGISVPERLLRAEVLREVLKDFDVILTPKEVIR